MPRLCNAGQPNWCLGMYKANEHSKPLAGGDLQDQVSLQLVLDLLDFKVSFGEAVVCPRFATSHHTGSFSQASHQPVSLVLSTAIDRETLKQLRSRGHRVMIQSKGSIGDLVMLTIDNLPRKA